MSLIPSLSLQSQSADATSAYLVDSTVYGAGTQLAASVVSSVITVSTSQSPLLYPAATMWGDFNYGSPQKGPTYENPLSSTLTGATSPTAPAFARGAILVLTDTTSNNAVPLSNGVYCYRYVLTFLDGTTSTGTGNFFLTGSAQLNLAAKTGAFAELDFENPNKDDESLTTLLEISMVITAASSVYYAGDLIGAQKMCQWLDLRFQTLEPGTMVANYGQLSLNSL